MVTRVTVNSWAHVNFLKPILHTIELSDGTVATAPVFDVKAKLISFLNDPHKMRQENIVSNYDIFSGKPILLTNVIDKIHTAGSLWADVCHKYCGDDPLAFPLGLVCLYIKRIMISMLFPRFLIVIAETFRSWKKSVESTHAYDETSG